MINKKIIIYQVLPRLFGNSNMSHKENGTITENGCGKLVDFDNLTLRRIHEMGITHIWYTGIIRHATKTDYSSFGIPRQHPAIVKGKAGSPYAIDDYYDVDPDLAVDVSKRMEEFISLVKRTKNAGMKVIIDFVPNHVARQYHSIAKPENIFDLGEYDNTKVNFSAQNNFYYCPGETFEPNFNLKDDNGDPYIEFPSKATGNDRFDNHPGINDWYETVKLNYGVDYTDPAKHTEYFDPIPDTWFKMVDILLFWASKGIDGFRCDMAEMVPLAFWTYAIHRIKELYPQIIFIGEIYDTQQYRPFIKSGFDYLYDKVGMYDCVRDVICDKRPASSITYQWQFTDDIHDHLLYFLENHDEQRIASDFFCGDANKALPGVMVCLLMRKNPFMIYSGQEFGEKGMYKEGFSGLDGRTSIFDYWGIPTIFSGYFDKNHLSIEEKELQKKYSTLFHIANTEKTISKGSFFDLMYVNPSSYLFNPKELYAFLRKYNDEVLFVVVNFSDQHIHCVVNIPKHAFDLWQMPEKDVIATDLLTDEISVKSFSSSKPITLELEPYSGRIYKFNIKMDTTELLLNEHNKDEFPPAHTAEHLLNQTMIRMFGCERSDNAHIERKKSKISYILNHKPDRKEEKAIEDKMNELIQADLPVTFEFVDRDNLPENIKLDRLPNNASETIRLVKIGDYDICPCIGKHVRSTMQIGRFEIIGTNWDQEKHSYRIRFKVVQ